MATRKKPVAPKPAATKPTAVAPPPPSPPVGPTTSTPAPAADPALVARWQTQPWDVGLAPRALPPLGLDRLRAPFTAADVAARLGVGPDAFDGRYGLAGPSLGLTADRDQLCLQATDGASTEVWGARLDQRWGPRRSLKTKQGWVSEDERWAAVFDAFFLLTFVPLVPLAESLARACQLLPTLWGAPKATFEALPGARADTLRLPPTAADPLTSTTVAVFDEDGDGAIDRLRLMVAALPEHRDRALETLLAQPGVSDRHVTDPHLRRIIVGGVGFTVSTRGELHLDTQGA